MKVVTLNKKVVKLYDSIDEMPIVNFQKYNKYLLIDSGLGSDTDDIDGHIVKVARYINANDKEKALAELQNMRQNMYMVNCEISPKHMAFAALIHSIDGKRLTDLSDDNLKDVLKELNEVRHSAIVEILLWLKKKVAAELETYFPGDFTSPKEKEAYDTLKGRTLQVLEDIVGDTDSTDRLKAFDDKLLGMFSPRNFSGSHSIEIKYDKQFETSCLIIAQELGADAHKMTVLQFYNAMDVVKQQSDAKSKGLKYHKK